LMVKVLAEKLGLTLILRPVIVVNVENVDFIGV